MMLHAAIPVPPCACVKALLSSCLVPCQFLPSQGVSPSGSGGSDASMDNALAGRRVLIAEDTALLRKVGGTWE